MASQRFFSFAILALFAILTTTVADIAGNVTGLDPIFNYCLRWQHQSIVKNDMLYVDGGIQTFRMNNVNYSVGPNVPNFLGVNEWVVKTWMNESWYWMSNITQEKIPKTVDSSTGIGAYNGTIRGALWQGPANDNRIYTFGGTSFRGNTSFKGWSEIQSSSTPLWSFDTQTGIWDTYPSSLLELPNYGASVEAPDQNLGFYLNGQVDSGSKLAYEQMENNTMNLPGMVIVDMANQTMVNISTPGLDDTTHPRIGGQLTYLPSIGKRGILVAMGGAYGNNAPGKFNTQTLTTYDEVSIFDISSYMDNLNSNGTWYSQKTSGTIPPARIDACTIMISAPDNSSHHIFLYGGRDPFQSNATTLYDDIYVLSIPSFTWTFIYEGDSPRWGHTCHVVGNRQMLTVGGSLNTTLTFCDWEFRGVAIFDLSSLIWGMYYIDPDPEYYIPSSLVQVVGGNQNGSATVTGPANGWNNNALAAVMSATRTQTPSITASITSVPQPSKPNNTGKIAGGAVGGVVGGASLIALIVLYLRLRRRRSTRAPRTTLAEAAGVEKSELTGDDKQPTEVADSREIPFEMVAEHGASEASPIPSPHARVELPARDAIEAGLIAELSGESVVPGGRLGIPRIDTSNLYPEGEWIGDKKERGVESPAQEMVRPPQRDFPIWEELKDIKNPDGP